MRHARFARLARAGLAVLLLAGCDLEARRLTTDEEARLFQVFVPLMRQAYGRDLSQCDLLGEAVDADRLDAVVVTVRDKPCDVGIRVTAATLSTLTTRALQTLLAHELAHALLKHTRPADPRPLAEDPRPFIRVSTKPFGADEEAAADREAARLLTGLWRGSNVRCLATADLYEDIARDRGPWETWLVRHPSPEHRVQAVGRACEAERRLWPR